MTSLLSPARLATRRYLSLSLSLSTPLSHRSYSDREAVADLVSKLQADPLLANSSSLLPPKSSEPSLPPVTRFPIANAPTPEEIVAADALAAHRAKLYGKVEDPMAGVVAAGKAKQRPPPQEPKEATVPYLKKDLPQKSDPLLDFFVNLIMKHGMKTKATIILHQTLDRISLLTGSAPIPIFKAAILKASPYARIRSSKKGAKVNFLPIPLTERQRVRTGIQWIVEASDKRPMTSVDRRLAAEILAVLAGDSPVLKRLDERHKTAMVNRANLPRTLGPMMAKDPNAEKKD